MIWEPAAVSSLWEQVHTLDAERKELEWQLSQIDCELREIREQRRLLLQQIEDIQGEIDWG